MNAYSERIFVLSLLSCVFSRTFLSGEIGAPIFSAFSRILPRVYLKSRNYRLFLQAQLDYALKILGIRKGFQGSLPYILLVFAKYPSFSLFSDTPQILPPLCHNPLPNFMRTPNPVRVLDTRKFSEQNFWGQASCTLPCVAVYLSVRFLFFVLSQALAGTNCTRQEQYLGKTNLYP